MYAESYYMPGKIEYYRGKGRRNIWMLPVFLCTFMILGAVFLILGYWTAREHILQVEAENVSGESVISLPKELWEPEDMGSPGTDPAAGVIVQATPEPAAPPCPVESPAPSMGPESSQEPEDAPKLENGEKPEDTQELRNSEEPDEAQESVGEAHTEKTKTMYLTFDDGPSAEYTDTILDVLAQYDIKATFFLVGENVEKRPEVAKRIVEEGHTIGIHCYSHAYDDIYDSVDSYVADFEKAYQVIYETTGVEVKIFRFPGGSVNGYNKHVCKDIITEMTERGYVYFDWNASLEDAVKKSTPEELLKNARDTVMDRDRVILLAHDTIYNTSLCIEDVILQFPEYKMEPLTEEVVPIRFRLK